MVARLTVALCSGRARLVPLVDMLGGRLRARGDIGPTCRLVVIWDRSLESLPPPQRELRLAAAGAFDDVRVLEPRAGLSLATGAGASGDVEPLLARDGYAARRNVALLDALDAGSDALLFLDDDEYLTAPWRDESGLVRWRPVDPLAPHLDALRRGADITNGTTLGEPSPIPRGLPRRVDPALLRRLGAALASGSEFLSAHSFLAGRVRLAAGPHDALPRPIEPVRGVRRLTGGNLGVDLHALRAGRLPPFHAPPGARGEDALFGARLGEADVRRVPCYLFHDPFGRYEGIPAGHPPGQLTPAPLTRATTERFGRALLGWLRYAPLLLRLRSPDEAWYRVGYALMREAVAEAAPALRQGLGWEGFASAPAALAEAHRRSERDVEELQATDEAWRRWMRQGAWASAQRAA
jgi:hypothetical protein